MILTGEAIKKEVRLGHIVIEPYCEANVNPNSYNYHLYPEIIEVSSALDFTSAYRSIQIPCSGYLLRPNALYLSCTMEVFSSKKYAMTLLGRSSIGRLGLFLNLSADLGHQGSSSRWTLELTAVQPIVIYPEMRIGQIAFWHVSGPRRYYDGRYKHDKSPYINKDNSLLFTGASSI